jgi:ligand-binding SRPBCC domain-containing protein
VLDRDDMSGAVAGVTPDYATNARVMLALGSALRRPAIAPAPGFALKLVLGEFAETLLGGQLIAPRKAAEAGFTWRHPQLEAAVIDVVAPNANPHPYVHAFESEQFVNAPMEKVFAFYSDGNSLEKLSPPALRLRTVTPASQTQMRAGATIEYALRVRGIPTRWRALIVEWVPGVRFTDVQVRGPFLWWRHTHEFERKGAGIVLRDRIDYALPLAPLSNVALPAVRRDIESAFTYRRRVIEEIFAA